MNKFELISAIAGATGMTKIASGKALEATLGIMAGALEQGHSVTLTGFGTFKVVDQAARVGRNPGTGESVQIDARRMVKFMPGPPLKKSVR